MFCQNCGTKNKPGAKFCRSVEPRYVSQ
ncbi:zinc-ribbon domain-containing protein [Pediococcus acidilactici]|nr:zinc-ribbon domain-containing protein [Pediococcus acidilactici]